MDKILPQIDHIVVGMMENRSFDDMCGWAYLGTTHARNSLRSTTSQIPLADLPDSPSSSTNIIPTATTLPLFNLQKSLRTAAAQQGKDPAQALNSVITRQDEIDLFTSNSSTSK
jgi:phospholipase C